MYYSQEHPLIKIGGNLLYRFRSTIGTMWFNFSVRNGKRWSPHVITALKGLTLPRKRRAKHNSLTSLTLRSVLFDCSCLFLEGRVLFVRSFRVISKAQLNRSLCVHLPPINVLVSNVPQWISYLVVGFALRCIQRLSLPDLDTRQCPWQNSRQTSGLSNTVLSY